MAVAVCKNNCTAVISKLAGCIISGLVFADTGSHNAFNAAGSAGSSETIDEVLIVGGVFIMESEETDFDVLFSGSKCAERNNQNKDKNCRNELFHVYSLS